MQKCTHSVKNMEVRGHVHFRSAGSGKKDDLETGKINKKQLYDNVKNKPPNNI